MKQYPVQFINLKNGETIAYRQSGTKGDIIILVHGNMSSYVHFQVVMEQLENDYQVYALDLRGFGDSSFKNPLNSLHDFAEDVELFVNALDLDNFNILGWSTGGGIILEVAADLKRRVKKIFLLDSVGIKGYPMFKKDEKGKPILTQMISTKEEIAADPIQVLPILQAYESNNRAVLRMIWDSVIYNQNKPSEEDYELYLDAIFKQRNLVDVDYSLVHFNMTNDSNGVTDGSGRMDLITAPIVILHGVNDLVVPISFAEEMKSYFKDRATLIKFEGAGHSVITDNLDLFITTLKKHL
ncbi:alpha/beta hydrolase [Mycoplasmatota bacterium]|nr:alpha/beta hydrolase [Mycoplasmatota bacterium]